jgi:hypothetical protein
VLVECWERKAAILWQKSVLLPLFRPQISRGLPWERTHVQIPAVRNWRFIRWDVAWPSPNMQWRRFYTKQPEWLWTGFRLSARARYVFLQDCQADIGWHSASMVTQRGGGGLFLWGYSGRSVKDRSELHLVWKLRVSLWHCACLSIEIILAYLLQYWVLLLIILLREFRQVFICEKDTILRELNWLFTDDTTSLVLFCTKNPVPNSIISLSYFNL